MLSKVLLVDFKEGEISSEYFSRIQKLFQSTQYVSSDDSNISNVLKDADAVLVKIFTKVDEKFISAAPKLKYIGVCSTAFDVIDVKYARSKNIPVCNLGGYSTEAVAEFFFAVLFERVFELERAKLQARAEDYSFDKFLGMELKNKVLGVIGAGKIGSRIATIGLGIGMKVIYFSRKNKPEIEKLGATKKELNDILSQSDFISLNLSLNQETEGIISKEKINLLKKDCVFISLAPPKLIDQEAMMEKAGKGEINFIFDHSDDIDKSLAKRFLETKNIIVYPPVAFRTKEANTAKWEILTSNIEGFVAGNLRNVVNK